jgi:hypothetical protein
MTWTSAMFEGVTTEVVDILTVIIPVAIGLFSIGLALRYGKKALRIFS